MSVSNKMKVGEEVKSSRKISDIYFRIAGDGERWYKIKACSDSSYSSRISKTRLQIELPPIPESLTSSRFAAIGSKIYASGGLDFSANPTILVNGVYTRYPSSNKVFSIDTLHPEKGWKGEHPMNVERYGHYMLVDDGKIYVLGGLNRVRLPVTRHIFAEVYDPLNSNEGWKQLARTRDDKEIRLPQTIYGHAVVDDGPLGRKILFHSHFHGSLYYLSTTQDNIGVYDEHFGYYHPPSVFLDGVFYFLDYDRVYAYIISSGKDQPVDLRDVKTNTLPRLEPCDEPMPTGYLLSVGNKCLALIWAKESDYGSFLDVHCSIIEMSKDGDSFVGHVLNCSTYYMEPGRFRVCQAVCVSLDAEHGGRSDKHQLEHGKKPKQHKRKWDQVVKAELDT